MTALRRCEEIAAPGCTNRRWSRPDASLCAARRRCIGETRSPRHRWPGLGTHCAVSTARGRPVTQLTSPAIRCVVVSSPMDLQDACAEPSREIPRFRPPRASSRGSVRLRACCQDVRRGDELASARDAAAGHAEPGAAAAVHGRLPRGQDERRASCSLAAAPGRRAASPRPECADLRAARA